MNVALREKQPRHMETTPGSQFQVAPPADELARLAKDVQAALEDSFDGHPPLLPCYSPTAQVPSGSMTIAHANAQRSLTGRSTGHAAAGHTGLVMGRCAHCPPPGPCALPQRAG